MSNTETYVIFWAICVKYVLPLIVFLISTGFVVYFAARKAVQDELRASSDHEDSIPSESSKR